VVIPENSTQLSGYRYSILFPLLLYLPLLLCVSSTLAVSSQNVSFLEAATKREDASYQEQASTREEVDILEQLKADSLGSGLDESCSQYSASRDIPFSKEPRYTCQSFLIFLGRANKILALKITWNVQAILFIVKSLSRLTPQTY
jgi:hypothetical protein